MSEAVASPPVAYLLLVAGLALVVFELYTGGIGIAVRRGAGFGVVVPGHHTAAGEDTTHDG